MKKILLSLFVAFLVVSCNSDVKKEDKKDNSSKVNTEKSENDSSVEKSKSDSSVEKVETIDGYSMYEGSHYSFIYPSDWELSEAQVGMMQVLSPLGKNDNFSENVNFIYQNIALLGSNYDKFYKQNLDEIKTSILSQKSGKVISEEDVKVGGLDSKKVIYKFNLGGASIRTTQYYVNADKGAYIITFTNNADLPDEKKEEFSKILESFRAVK